MASAINQLIAQGGDDGNSFLKSLYQGQQMAQARRQGEIQDVQIQKALREEERAQGQAYALAKLANQYEATGDKETAGLIRAGGPAVFAKLLDQKMDPKAGYMAAGDILYDMRGGSPKPVGGNIPMVDGQPYTPGLGSGGRGPVPTPGGGGFADRVVQRESGGDPNATNPNSTATGAGQFLERTWLDLLPRHAPDVVATVAGPNADLKNPQTRAALLDLRRDPELSKTMVDAYAKDNAAYFRSAGIEPTPANLMVAHFLGGAGATRFLQSDPNVPATSVVSPDAVMANRNVFFDPKTNQPRTVGQLRQMAEQSAAGAGGPGGAPAPGQGQPQPSVTPMTDPVGRPFTKDAPAGMMWGRDAQGRMVAMPIPGSGATTLSAQEAQAAGFQPGAVVQRDASGKLSVVEKGDTLSPEAFRQKADLARAGRAETTIDMKAEGEEAKAEGKRLVDEFQSIQQRGQAAQDALSQINIARTIPEKDANGNPLPGVFRQQIGNVAVALGFNPESPTVQSVIGRVSDGQSFNGVMQNLVLTKMQTQKGPQTESDAKRIESTVASLGNTPAARDFLLRTSTALAQRDVDQQAFYEQWKAGSKSYAGASKAWREHLASVPLVGTQPSTGKAVFFNEFRDAYMRQFPDAPQDKMLNDWRTLYASR
ncbi:hypothetical protein [Azospirillum argentinense]|uniref:hypothetical protein n=1 Tax=Azospirillum argentinense TaxID=2970906 RepID=UPI0032DF92D0